MFEKVVVRHIRRFAPDSRAELWLAVEKEELENLESNLNCAFLHPHHLSAPRALATSSLDLG